MAIKIGGTDVINNSRNLINIVNAGIGTTNPTSRLHMVGIGSDGPTLQFENLGTSLSSGDDLGTIDFISNDSSANANGSRVRLLADVTNTNGSGRFSVQIKSSNSSSFNTPLTVNSNTLTVNSNTLTRSGAVTYTDVVNSIDYNLLINRFENSSISEIYGYTLFDNTSNTKHVLIDLTPYITPSFAYSNFVKVEATGMWINADGTSKHIVSRIYTASFYIDYAETTWSVQPNNISADETDATNFPVASRILLGLYSNGVSTIPQLRLYGRNTTTGITYYSFKLTTITA